MRYFEDVLKWVKKDVSGPKYHAKCPVVPPMMKKAEWSSDRSLIKEANFDHLDWGDWTWGDKFDSDFISGNQC